MGVCGNVCSVAAVVKDSVFSLGFLKYVVCLCKGCDGCCVFCLYCDAWSCRCSGMGSMSVSSCRCCLFVSCVHHVAVLNAAFCMTCSSFLICVCMFIVSKSFSHISSVTVIVRAGGAIWLNPFATVLFSVCSAITVECCVMYPCCMGVLGMFAVM